LATDPAGRKIEVRSRPETEARDDGEIIAGGAERVHRGADGRDDGCLGGEYICIISKYVSNDFRHLEEEALVKSSYPDPGVAEVYNEHRGLGPKQLMRVPWAGQ
jgi:hypothetical protein